MTNCMKRGIRTRNQPCALNLIHASESHTHSHLHLQPHFSFLMSHVSCLIHLNFALGYHRYSPFEIPPVLILIWDSWLSSWPSHGRSISQRWTPNTTLWHCFLKDCAWNTSFKVLESYLRGIAMGDRAWVWSLHFQGLQWEFFVLGPLHNFKSVSCVVPLACSLKTDTLTCSTMHPPSIRNRPTTSLNCFLYFT